MEPRITDADLRLLLAESGRDEPYLVSPRDPDPPAPSEELDERILAGLVVP